MTKDQANTILSAIIRACLEGYTHNFSLNRERARHAAQVMDDVVSMQKPFDIVTYYKETECGTTACIMGYVAMTPEWAAAGGGYSIRDRRITMRGSADIEHGLDASMVWFGSEQSDTEQVIYERGGDIQINPLIEKLVDFEHYHAFVEAMVGFRSCYVVASPWRTMAAVQASQKHGTPLAIVTPEQARDLLNSIAETGSAKTYPYFGKKWHACYKYIKRLCSIAGQDYNNVCNQLGFDE